MDNGKILLFQTQGGETKIEVRLSNETVWFTSEQMTVLFRRNKSQYLSVNLSIHN